MEEKIETKEETKHYISEEMIKQMDERDIVLSAKDLAFIEVIVQKAVDLAFYKYLVEPMKPQEIRE